MTVFHQASIREALTLSGHYYTAPEIFDRETRHIFYSHWLCVGRSEQLAEAGDYFLAQVCEQNLIIVRDAQGAAHAFFNLCPRCGTPLLSSLQGHLGETIGCAKHGWKYSLEGQLRSHRSQNAAAEKTALFSAALSEWEGFLWVNLAPNPAPFAPTFSPLLGQFGSSRLTGLRVGEQLTFDLQANWKLIFQAYCDRYHHSQTAQRSPSLSQGAFLGASQPLDRDFHSSMLWGEGDRAYHYSLFPTMLLSLYPNAAIALRLYPQAADQTRIVCEWLFDRPANRLDRVAIEAWQFNHRQAWLRCEQMQRTMHTAHSAPFKATTAFDREYLRVLGDALLR